MRRVAPTGVAVGMLATLLALVGGGLVSNVAALGPDKSDVVMEFDFSFSITSDKANRTRFASAIDQIANRVTDTGADLTAGDTTVSLIQFATRAADVPGCVDLHLLNDPAAVHQFSTCLHNVANQYKSGGSAALTKSIGVDTNYVAALQKAEEHLPADAIRPAVIFFTDGKHDVAGVPFTAVLTERDKLVGSRTSIAILPVGMGLAAGDRANLQKNLSDLQVVRGIPDCAATGAGLVWPTSVFTTPGDAGTAVGQALADATCTYTVAPTPTPPPAPKPPVVSDIRLTPGDGKIDLIWSPASQNTKVPVTDYLARCRAGDNGAWIESKEGVSLAPRATVDGLTNGTAYECEVATVGKDGPGTYTPAGGTATPIGPPAAPPAPTVTAGNGTLDVAVPPQTDADRIAFECASDPAASPATGEAEAANPATRIAVTNGVSYQCRAIAANAVGESGPSALSAAAFPCNGFLQCTPSLLPIIGGGIGVLVLGILIAAFFLYRDRQRGHVVAVVDVVHTANIGHGSSLGVGFVHSPETKKVTGIVADRGRKADIRIRRLRHGRFEVHDKTGTHVVGDGDPVVVADSVGGRHSLVLRAFSTNAASQVATRR